MGGFIFCRIKEAKKPIEWQADYFASCMLMPENAVRDAFCKCYGSKPLMLYNVKSAFCGPICFDPCVETWPKIAGLVKKAGGFSNVSKQAMIIRLQDLGLVQNETRARLSWAESNSYF
jgi:Zn-dependent peptidase ImmA (M78 family)